MIPKALRITSREFKGTKTRLHYRGAFFDVSIAPGETTKFAVIISKKRIKRAVDRNKAKRRVYALLKDIHTKAAHFVFIYPNKNLPQAPHQTLVEEITKAFATL